MSCGRWVVVVVGVLTACGGNARHGDAGADGLPADGSLIDAPIDGPPIDAPPRCGDGHLDPGEQCDGIEGLSGDGCSATCTPEAVAWRNLTPNPAPQRDELAIAYDSDRRRLVLFGGYDSTITDTNETWEFDGTSWVMRLTLVAPSARHGHGMVYDSVRKRVVLFGGDGGLSDTWEWDGMTWLQRTSTLSPPPLSHPFIAYDPVRAVTVLWDQNTVWEWDGTAWSMTTATVPQCCGAGALALTYGGSSGVMLIGADAVWFWNGASWTRQALTALPVWNGYSLLAAYDSTAGRPIAFSFRYTDRDGLSVWEWSNGNWVLRPPVPSGGPQIFPRGATAYDSDRGVMMVLGDANEGYLTTEVWEWNGTAWRIRHDAAPPPPRHLPAMAYDARRARLVMFGGRGLLPTRLDDTWEWDGTTWHERTPATRPPARVGAGATYDERRGRVVIHGGITVTYDQSGANQIVFLEDTWEWDGTDWQEVIASPHPGFRLSMAFDRAHGYVLGVSDNETWKFDGAAWTKLTPPLAAPGGHVTYDARRGVVVLLTSFIGPNGLRQMWDWSGTNWISSMVTVPDSVFAFYDPLRARVIVHGGRYTTQDFYAWDGVSLSSALTAHEPLEATTIFDPTTGAWFSFGEISGWDTWLFGSSGGTPREQCDGSDADGDGLLRCNDPDCWWRCTPLCAPGELFCDPLAPRCGDGVCSSIEGNSLCPADCP
jgi:cysteine-rich repeat protein